MHLWDYVEEGSIADMADLTGDFYKPPNTYGGTLDGATGKLVDLYYCPSDTGSDQTVGNYQRAAGARNSQRTAARSRHPGGVNASRCDGSVTFVSEGISLNVGGCRAPWMVGR